jgi:hypothetical protein
MWALKNHTPYAADRTWIRDKNGGHHWVVVVKATFDIIDSGKLQLADEQVPCSSFPEYYGEPGFSSLRRDADVGPPKPTTDILLEASAYAPGARPTTAVPVSMRVGEIEKTVIVHGPRVYYEGVTGMAITRGTAFAQRPMRYEDSYGGSDMSDPDPDRQRMDLRNPVGKGVAGSKARLLNTPAHSIEYTLGDPDKRGPAGFGPLASYWTPRRDWAGTYDEAWASRKKPLLPDDYDERFVLSAPEDQRPRSHLRGGEIVSLINATPNGVLHFALPKIFLTFATAFGRKREDHRARLGTVVIEPDDRKLKLIWQSSIPVSGREADYLDDTTIAEKSYIA